MPMLHLRKGDHVLIRAKVKYDVTPSDPTIFLEFKFYDMTVKPEEIVQYEPSFEVGERVQGPDGEAGEILKIRDRTAIVLWDSGSVDCGVDLNGLLLESADQ